MTFQLMDRRFVRFLTVGLLNTAFGYGCFALLLLAGVGSAVALLVATILGVFFNFKTIGLLVFRSRENRRIVRFVLVYGVVYSVNLAGLEMLVCLGMSAYLAGALLILPCAALAFLLQKHLVYTHD